MVGIDFLPVLARIVLDVQSGRQRAHSSTFIQLDLCRLCIVCLACCLGVFLLLKWLQGKQGSRLLSEKAHVIAAGFAAYILLILMLVGGRNGLMPWKRSLGLWDVLMILASAGSQPRPFMADLDGVGPASFMMSLLSGFCLHRLNKSQKWSALLESICKHSARRTGISTSGAAGNYQIANLQTSTSSWGKKSHFDFARPCAATASCSSLRHSPESIRDVQEWILPSPRGHEVLGQAMCDQESRLGRNGNGLLAPNKCCPQWASSCAEKQQTGMHTNVYFQAPVTILWNSPKDLTGPQGYGCQYELQSRHHWK